MIFDKNPYKLIAFCLDLRKRIHYSKKGTFNAVPQTIFNIVKKTDKYSQFIPWCARSQIVKDISTTKNLTQLTIAFKKVKQLKYLSCVQISGQNNSQSKKYKIESVCKDYPLKSLVSIWQISKDFMIEGQLRRTEVNYSIDYEFATPFLQLTSHFFLNYVGESMWLIFKEEAQKKQIIADSLSVNKMDKHSGHMDQEVYQKSDKVQNEIKQNNEDLGRIKSSLLSDYFRKNPETFEIYRKNQQFKQLIEQWSKNLDGTKQFQQKIDFAVKNYLAYKR